MNSLSHPQTLAANLFAAGLLLACGGSSLAEVHYVDVNSTNATLPYANWATAATNIQDAVDVAVAGDEVVVTNGVYSPVAADKPLSLASVNGPDFTFIDASAGLTRCAHLTNGASLSGFTLTNGQAAEGGGAYGGTVNNCILTGNSASDGGGAAHCTLNNCVLTGNWASSGYGGGGGGAAFGTLNNCTLTGNYAVDCFICFGNYTYGGGAYGCTLNDCVLTGNQAIDISGSGDRAYSPAVHNCALNHCVLYTNSPGDSAYFYTSNTLNSIVEADPLFVGLAAGNLRLRSSSPCINAGDNAYSPASPDLDGNPRIVGGTVDIGAYEYQSLSLLNFIVVSNQAGFNITGQSNQVAVVEVSADLTNWSPLATNILFGHPFPFSDPAPANLPRRFYRAQAQ